MKKVLLTGGAGFIGSDFCRQFSDEYDITVIDKMGYASNIEALPNNVKLIKSDVVGLQLSTLSSWLVKDVDYIIHMAAESHVDNSIHTPEVCVKNNILSSLEVLEACRVHNIPTIMVGTDEVFGEGTFTENSPINPRNPYSASKASADMMALAYFNTFQCPVIVTNCCNNYGIWQHPEKLIPKCITNIKNGKAATIYGNGKQVRDWISVKDHNKAIRFLMNEGEYGERYCIGANCPHTNNEVVERIMYELKECDPKVKYVAQRPGVDEMYRIDNLKLVSMGWSPVDNFDYEIKQLCKWYK